ncbi:alpha/beta hydrolase [Streptomyces sp. NPDC001515]
MTESSQYTDHFGPDGPRVRGTVLVVPGRGESRASYARFGRRLAADAYRVRVLDAPALDATDPPAALSALAARLADALEGTAGDGGVAHPVVLAGSDSGAAAVAALLGRTGTRLPDGVVLAGLPGRGSTSTGTWDEELDVRTACPAHRQVLGEDASVRRGSLAEPVPAALLDAAYGDEQGSGAARAAVPALLLVGDEDPLADRAALAHLAKSRPRTRLSVVRGGRHDVLNDLQHRAVAAEVVTFLETLRNGLAPVITVESSAW